jgi:hypothetical protein
MVAYDQASLAHLGEIAFHRCFIASKCAGRFICMTETNDEDEQ